jgi:hypothetical protein
MKSLVLPAESRAVNGGQSAVKSREDQSLSVQLTKGPRSPPSDGTLPLLPAVPVLPAMPVLPVLPGKVRRVGSRSRRIRVNHRTLRP